MQWSMSPSQCCQHRQGSFPPPSLPPNLTAAGRKVTPWVGSQRFCFVFLAGSGRLSVWPWAIRFRSALWWWMFQDLGAGTRLPKEKACEASGLPRCEGLESHMFEDLGTWISLQNPAGVWLGSSFSRVQGYKIKYVLMGMWTTLQRTNHAGAWLGFSSSKVQGYGVI